MTKSSYFLSLLLATVFAPIQAKNRQTKSPDENLCVTLECEPNSIPTYSVTYKGKTMIEPSPLGLHTDIADFTKEMTLESCTIDTVIDSYQLSRIKHSNVNYKATRMVAKLQNAQKRHIDIEFQIANNSVAFRYLIPKETQTGCVKVEYETTGFRFPDFTTTFLTPQSDAMIGWKRSKPSYEEIYHHDAPMSERSQYGHGYTFPGLFHVGDRGWVLVSETGVDSHYCGSHLSDFKNGIYSVAFAMPEENNGNGTVAPAFALPGSTPWRTLAIGEDLKPIVENTIAYDVVRPLYETEHDYQFGRSSWSWIVWQDASMNWKAMIL